MNELRRGRIVWVELLDPQGRNPKIRPAVVLSATAAITPEGSVWIAAITKQIDTIPDEFAALLPWMQQGHPETKLKEPCAVACHWVASVPVSAVQRVSGRVPDRLMIEVLAAVNQLPPTE